MVHRVGVVINVCRQAGLTDVSLRTGPLAVEAIGVIADCVSASPNVEQKALYKCGVATMVRFQPSAGSNGAYSIRGAWRVPSTVDSEYRPGQPVVHTLNAHWAAGPPSKAAQPEGRQDDAEQRATWTRSCLDRLSEVEAETPFRSIAFSSAQFESTLMRAELERFAGNHPKVRVLLVGRASAVIGKARRNTIKEIRQTTKTAMAFLSRECKENRMTRTIGHALCKSIEKQLCRSILGENEKTATAEVFAAYAGDKTVAHNDFAETFKRTVEGTSVAARIQHRESLRALERDKQLTDQRYQAYREKQYKQGLISEVDLRWEAALMAKVVSSVQVKGEAMVCGSTDENAQNTQAPDSKHRDECQFATAVVRGEPSPRIRVNSARGAHTPCRLLKLHLVNETGTRMKRVAVPNNIFDSGAGLTFFGTSLVNKLRREQPGMLRSVEPLPSSVQRIQGIGAGNRVKEWVACTIDIGGVLIDLEDSPVIDEIDDLLLGNDTIRAIRARMDYREGPGYAGTVTIQNSAGMALSEAVPFAVTKSVVLPFVASAQPSDVYLAEPQERTAIPVPTVRLSLVVGPNGSVKAVTTLERTLTPEIKRVLGEVAPLGYAPKPICVKAWCQQYIRVRIPASIPPDMVVALLPIEDPSLPDLGVLVAPTLDRADKNGYVWVQVLNPTRKEVTIPLLRPIVRFIIDPEVGGPEVEFTPDEVMKAIHVGPESKEDRNQCRQMLRTRLSLFRTKLGYSQTPKVDIETPRVDSGEIPAAAITTRPRPPEVEAVLEATCQKLYKSRIIEPASRSPFNAQMVPLVKPDGTIRPATDYRALNQQVRKDSFPLPNADANLNALGRANWFTTLDLLQGFLQLELTESAKAKTAFTVNGRQWQYTRLPMGLTTSPSAFMRVVDAALRGLPPGIAFAYVDDVIIPTTGSLKQHLNDVGMVFDKLIQAGFAVRCDKVHLAMKQVMYLGFLVGTDGTSPHPSKTSALLDMSVQDMGLEPAAAARYAGMIGFYHKFLPDLNSTLAPFHQLKAKGADAREIMTSLKFLAAFEHTKHQLATVTALARPDYSKPFYIDVDASSSVGTGAVLSQYQDDKDLDSLRPLAFWSRRFLGEERRYGVRDQECQGLTDALEAWRPYVAYSPVIVRTDHRSLEWLLATNHKEGTRVSGFALKVQGYDVTIKYIPGPLNIVGDCMSRNIPPLTSRSFGRGGERGKVPPPSLVDRPEIEDRVYEAITERVVASEFEDRVYKAVVVESEFEGHHSSSANLTVAVQPEAVSAYTCAAFAIVAENGLKQVKRQCSSFQRRHQLHAVSQQPAQQYQRREETLAVKSTVRHSDRAVAFILHVNDGAVFLLLEEQDGQLTLPAVNHVDKWSKQSYRAQLIDRMHLTYRDSESLVKAISEAEHRRSRRRYPQHFFIVHYPFSQPTPVCKNHTLRSTFFRLDVPLLSLLATEADREAALLFAAEYILKGFAETLSWAEAPLQAAAVQRFATVSVYLAAELPKEQQPVDARITLQAPYGPALIDSQDDLPLAFRVIRERLERIPTPSVAIDLEGHQMGAGGHISLIQLCIDTTGSGEQAVVYVFDVIECGLALFSDTSFTLRAVLEDPAVVKVLHCCYGDAAALFDEWGVTMRAVFDTSIADALVLSRHSGKPRGLGTVLKEWLGEQRVVLTYKGVLEHTPHLWDQRPLTVRLFTYAYEDVTYCNQLYERLSSLLRQQGMLELTFALSRQRCPPITLSLKHPQCEPPEWVAVALCDLKGRVLCEQESGSRQYRLVRTRIECVQEPLPLKRAAQEAWSIRMGSAVKSVDISVRVRLRKATRVGDSLLYTAYVSDLLSCFVELSESRQFADNRLILRQRFVASRADAGVVETQRLLFQQLHSEASRSTLKKGALADVFNQDSVSLHVDTHMTVAGTYVSLQLLPVLRVVNLQSALVAVPSIESMRVAVILADDRCVYTIRSVTGIPSFPSHGIGGNPHAEAAASAFDTYAGVSLRKLDATGGRKAHNVMPITSRHVRAAEEAQQLIGQFGNTVYYLWRWYPLTEAPAEFQSLADFALSFHASRQESNGFQMVPSKEKVHPSFAVESIEAVTRKLEVAASSKEKHRDNLSAKFDKEALAAATRMRSSQHSDSVRSAAAAIGTHSESQERRHVAQHSELTEPSIEFAVPEWGVDAEFDALFTCAVAFYAGTERRDCSEDEIARAYAAESKTDHLLTRKQLISEQADHPGTGQYVTALREGELASGRTPDVQQHILKNLRLEEDGLLVWQPEGVVTARIVLTPASQRKALKSFHDLNGHFGVRTVLRHLTQRYYWGTDKEMRCTVSDYIRTCEPCARAKVPRHHLGAMQIIDCGDHPGDILSGDVFDTGVVYEEYSHTLDFVCHFSRRVTSTAMKGMPNSEAIARVLIDRVIRTSGVPSEIRSDRGTNFISKGMRVLYELFGIRINPGSAYSHHLVALVERWHQTLLQLLRTQKAAGLDDNWPSRLGLLELAFNTAINDSIGYSPFFVDHLRHALLPLDAMTGASRKLTDVEMPDWVRRQLQTCGVVYEAASKSLRLHALNSKKRFDLKHDVVTSFRPGDRVLLIRGEVLDKAPMSKADLPTEGPFTVTGVLEHNRYVLKDLKSRRVHNVVHLSRLIPFPERPPPADNWMLNDPRVGDGQYAVHSVVGRRVNKDASVSYKVRWVGFSAGFDSWFQSRGLATIAPLIQLYDKGIGKALAPTPREPRESEEPLPEPTVEAMKRARFRFRPSRESEMPWRPSQVPKGLPDLSAPLAEDSEAIVAGEPECVELSPAGQSTQSTTLPARKSPLFSGVPDLSDPFPTGSRVEVAFEDGKRWWSGTVISTRIYRPRTGDKLAERRIVVQYDDIAYKDQPFEHGLNNSVVRLLKEVVAVPGAIPLTPLTTQPTPLPHINPHMQGAVALGAHNPNMDGSPRAQAFNAQASELRKHGTTASVALALNFHRLHLGVQFYRPPKDDGLDAAEAVAVSEFWTQAHTDGGFQFRVDSRGGIGVFASRARILKPSTRWGTQGRGNALPLAGVCFRCDEPGAHDLDGLIHVPFKASNLWAGSLVGPISLINTGCDSCANVAFGSHTWSGDVLCIRARQIRAITVGEELLACYPLAFADARCPKCNALLTADVGVGSSIPSTPVETGWARYQPFGRRCQEVNLSTGAIRYAEVLEQALPLLTLTPAPPTQPVLTQSPTESLSLQLPISNVELPSLMTPLALLPIPMPSIESLSLQPFIFAAELPSQPQQSTLLLPTPARQRFRLRVAGSSSAHPIELE